jgi:hypothetical protein
MLCLILGFFSSICLANTSLKIEKFYLKSEPSIQYTNNRFYLVFSSDEDYVGKVTVTYPVNGKEIVILQDELIKVIGGQKDGIFVDVNFPVAGDIDLNVKVIDQGNPEQVIENKEKVTVLVDTDRDGQANINDADDDNDGLSDVDEVAIGTNPLLVDTDGDGFSDTKDVFPLDSKESADNDKDGMGDNADLDDDNDGLSDTEELAIGTNPLSADTDNDGLTDSDEIKKTTNPRDNDTDKDGVFDGADPFPLDNMRKADSDGDGIADEDELKAGLDPNKDDADLDNDADGVNNYDEVVKYKTNPNNADSDADQIQDKTEIDHGLNPNLKDDAQGDKDNDGVVNSKEIVIGSNLNSGNTFGISDGVYSVVYDYSPWILLVIVSGLVVIVFRRKLREKVP